MKTSLARFRTMALICGVSLLILTFVYMPVKYLTEWGKTSEEIKLFAIAHGYFYIIYILTVLQLGVQKRMSLLKLALLVIAGTVPFASFVAERKIVRQYS